MLSKRVTFFGVLFIVASYLFSQTTNTRRWRKTQNDSMQNALFLFEDANFLTALPIYEKLYEAHPNELYLAYCYGKCALYRSDKHEMAHKLLSEVYEKNKKTVNIEYDLARAKHYNYKFDEALTLIEKFVSRKKVDSTLKKEALLLKQYCLNAKHFHATPTEAVITNAGNSLNSEYSECIPLISADESTIIYTYNGVLSLGGLRNELFLPDKYGKYYDDIYTSHKELGLWSKPEPITILNTTRHDKTIALSADGSHLFTYKDTADDHGDIYESRLINGNWSRPEKLRGEVNTYSWEGSCSITADGKYLYFSSERRGGLGGKDIYRATLLPDTTWGHVVNLGDNINTPFDDDTPFIHPDGVTLFYSSKGKNSMGDYDVFQTRWNSMDSTFSSPINLGYPINTPDADVHYVLSANSETGYYASGKLDGHGLQDIYLVNQGYAEKKPSLYLVKGKIQSDAQPVTATITIQLKEANKQYGIVHSNNSNGNYLLCLPEGAEFVLTYSYKSFPVKVFSINTLGMQDYQEQVFDVNFNTGDTLQKKIITEPKTSKDLVAVKPTNTKPFEKSATPVKQQEEFIPQNALQAKTKIYSEKYGNISVEGLEFRVQIAAFKSSKTYEFKYLKHLGKIEELVLGDGITRLTIGDRFKTLAQAFEHNKKVVKAGQRDAFVTVLFNEKRVFLEELERMGIYVEK